MLTGCQSTTYRWINTDVGFPSECKTTISNESTVLEYCLTEDEIAGQYHFEGVLKTRGAHTHGRIESGSFALVLLKGTETVEKIRLNRQGNDMGRAIYLSRDFEFYKSFDDVTIIFNVKYRY